MTNPAKFGDDLFTGDWAVKPQTHVDFGFFLFFSFFLNFIVQPTAQTTEPISMVDGSNDVFSRKEVPFGGHVITWPEMWAWHPKNPLFWTRFWQNVIRSLGWVKTDVPPELITRFRSLRAQMTWIPARFKFIQIVAHHHQLGVHRPPKTSKFGGQRYSEKIKIWPKIKILRFTQCWYQLIGFDL